VDSVGTMPCLGAFMLTKLPRSPRFVPSSGRLGSSMVWVFCGPRSHVTTSNEMVRNFVSCYVSKVLLVFIGKRMSFCAV
jgi:hypothetical protein